MIGVDGRVAFVTGLCVGQRWAGYPERGIDAWRDTGVEIEGPAVADVERAFADAWGAMGDTLPSDEIPSMSSIPPAGRDSLRIVASLPNVGSIYRLDQLLATLAQKRMWLSDAYFVGTSSYVQALRNAALAGVDVRLLIPAAYDVPGIRAISRAGLRPLLEVGVRVFEWNGSMMHAKTAVIDGHWARVGSTNLNISSWIANWELDVVVENDRFAKEMEEMFLRDIENSTEIVLSATRRMQRPKPLNPPARRRLQRPSASKTAADVVRLSHTVGAALTNHRELGPAEAVIMIWSAILLGLFSTAALLWPVGVTLPIAVFTMWLGITLLIRAFKLRLRARSVKRQKRRVA
jgi:cardiolipin synthase